MKNVNYNWIISQMDTKPSEDNLTDVVVVVHWRRCALTTVEGKDYTAEVYGTYSCPLPSGEDFTPYEDLTEEQVEGWLDAGLDVEQLNATLDSELENLINPPVIVLPLPWAPPTEEIVAEEEAATSAEEEDLTEE